MSDFFTEVRETLIPVRASKDGPLPPLLVMLTVCTGLVDSFSFLELGRVFVANMTGNVVFVAFALAGVQGFSIPASILGVLAFLFGAFSSGRMISRSGGNRGRLLASGAAVQAVLLAAAATVAALFSGSVTGVTLYVLVVVLGFCMGVQNGVARKLAVPDLTTTVLSLTITGLGSDSRLAGGLGSHTGRRTLSILSMFLGALIGAGFFVLGLRFMSLVVALVLVSTVAAASWALSRTKQPWLQGR